MEHFIKLLSNEGDNVLDPVMGAGSTGIASVINNRKFYGIELNEEYFNISKLIRFKMIEISSKTGIPHLASSLSCVDIIIFLYEKVLNNIDHLIQKYI